MVLSLNAALADESHTVNQETPSAAAETSPSGRHFAPTTLKCDDKKGFDTGFMATSDFKTAVFQEKKLASGIKPKPNDIYVKMKCFKTLPDEAKHLLPPASQQPGQTEGTRVIRYCWDENTEDDTGFLMLIKTSGPAGVPSAEVIRFRKTYSSLRCYY